MVPLPGAHSSRERSAGHADPRESSAAASGAGRFALTFPASSSTLIPPFPGQSHPGDFPAASRDGSRSLGAAVGAGNPQPSRFELLPLGLDPNPEPLERARGWNGRRCRDKLGKTGTKGKGRGSRGFPRARRVGPGMQRSLGPCQAGAEAFPWFLTGWVLPGNGWRGSLPSLCVPPSPHHPSVSLCFPPREEPSRQDSRGRARSHFLIPTFPVPRMLFPLLIGALGLASEWGWGLEMSPVLTELCPEVAAPTGCFLGFVLRAVTASGGTSWQGTLSRYFS